jgi:hypothetical protein
VTLHSLLDAPEHLLATHDRLRRNGFPVVTLINAHAPLDARVWYCRWAQKRGRFVVYAPKTNTETALAAYRARVRVNPNKTIPDTNPPGLLIPGEFRQALAVAVELTEQHPEVPAVIASGVASVVDDLLNMNRPQELVVAALRVLVEGQVAHGDHPVLTMCVSHTVITLDDAGNHKPSKRKSSGRIDDLIALTMAIGVAPLQQKPIDIEALIG